MSITASHTPPQNAADALTMMDLALDYLTGADLRALGTAQQGEALTTLSRITARISAVQAAVLAVFDAAGGPEEAGCGTVSTWLVRNTQATKGSAGSQRRWSRPDIQFCVLPGLRVPAGSKCLASGCQHAFPLPDAHRLPALSRVTASAPSSAAHPETTWTGSAPQGDHER